MEMRACDYIRTEPDTVSAGLRADKANRPKQRKACSESRRTLCPTLSVCRSEHTSHIPPAAASSFPPSPCTLFRLIKRKDKFGPNAFRADHVDVLVVGADDLLDDGKTQPRSFPVFSAGSVDLVKPFPDFGKAVPGNPDAGIFHGYKYFPVFFCGLYRDGGVVVGKFDGVVDQIVQHLLDLSHICRDVQCRRWDDQADGDLPGGADAFEGRRCVFDHGVDVEGGDLQHVPFAVYVVQCQQALGQFVQPVCLEQDDVQVAVLHFRRDCAVGDGFHIAFDGGQRRAEVVGDVGYKFFLVFSDLVQFPGHVV